MVDEKRQIKEPWCVYGYLSVLLPNGFGKIVGESELTYDLIYDESGSLASYVSWDKKYVKRFETLEQAIKYFIEHKPEYDVRELSLTNKEIESWARYQFPSQFQEEEKR